MDDIHTLLTMLKDCEYRLQWTITHRDRAELCSEWAKLKERCLEAEEAKS